MNVLKVLFMAFVLLSVFCSFLMLYTEYELFEVQALLNDFYPSIQGIEIEQSSTTHLSVKIVLFVPCVSRFNLIVRMKLKSIYAETVPIFVSSGEGGWKYNIVPPRNVTFSLVIPNSGVSEESWYITLLILLQQVPLYGAIRLERTLEGYNVAVKNADV